MGKWTGRWPRNCRRSWRSLAAKPRLAGLGGFLFRVAFLLGRLERTGDHRLLPADVLVRDDVLARVLAGRQLVHHIQHEAFQKLTQRAGAGLLLDRLLRNGAERVLGEIQLRVLHLEEALVLADEGV